LGVPLGTPWATGRSSLAKSRGEGYIPSGSPSRLGDVMLTRTVLADVIAQESVDDLQTALEQFGSIAEELKE